MKVYNTLAEKLVEVLKSTEEQHSSGLLLNMLSDDRDMNETYDLNNITSANDIGHEPGKTSLTQDSHQSDVIMDNTF